MFNYSRLVSIIIMFFFFAGKFEFRVSTIIENVHTKAYHYDDVNVSKKNEIAHVHSYNHKPIITL